MKNFKLLLVDDEEEFVSTLAARLNLRDIRGDVALNGSQALHDVDEDEPDVMVLDLSMPGIDGMEVLRRVRTDFPNVQVIIQTGHGNIDTEKEARCLGVFDYLRKPVNIEVLVERIKAAAKAHKGVPIKMAA